MPVGDYSTDPASNTDISGISIAEGCAAANINNAFRQLMADIATMYAGLPDTSSLMPTSGGVFTGNPTFIGVGAYHFNATPTGPSGGRWTVQASGGAAPSAPGEGDYWGEW